VAIWVTFQTLPALLGPDAQHLAFLAWSLPLVAWLARESFAPAARLRTRHAVRSAYA